MTIEQQVTSLELSKRLKELGVKQESLFHWCEIWELDLEKKEMVDTGKREPIQRCQSNAMYRIICSAFTVAELGELLPRRDYQTDDNNRDTGDLASWVTFKSDGKWHCSLTWRYTRTNTEYITADTEADARAKMLVYLLENKLITL